MIDKLPILSIETSQNCCGACVYFNENKFFEMSVNSKFSHAEKIFEIIDTVLNSSGLTLNDLGAIAVSSGPGSFTGLRIGMSAAKGVGFGALLPIIAVPTFEALAFQLSNTLNDGTEFVIANKVNSEEIYFAKFKVKANNYIFARDLQIVKSAYDVLIDENCLVYGNAAFKNIPAEKIINISYPKPEYVAKWARQFYKEELRFDYDFLEPNYFKNFIVKEKSNV
jgi:tRNA threonylcarbamoyladenosine biosynthesis protein TsaB